MAVSHLSGGAALLWSIMPNASYKDIKKALLEGVRPGNFPVKSGGSLYLPGALSKLQGSFQLSQASVLAQ